MKTLQEAQQIILENITPAPVEELPLEDAVGCVLAEDVMSDVNMPPFDKSAMDGYAVRAADVASAPAVLSIIDTVIAGAISSKKVGEGECVRIMTGAPLPQGADTVVRVEDTKAESADRVRIETASQCGANVCVAGEDLTANAVALETGRRIRAQEILLLATAGAARVRILQKPSVAFFATGSELVSCFERPRDAMIRDSNSSLLFVRLQEMGIPFRSLGIVEDTEAALRAKMREGLVFDFLLLTGGVSMGEYDIVTKALQEEGVEIHFDTLALRPGKPFTFGKRGETLVFGLPGNPVTVFVCFELFVKPALRKRFGRKNPIPAFLQVPLRGKEQKMKRNGRDMFFPASLENEKGALSVSLVEWHGSGDIVGLSRSNCLVHFPPGTESVAPGTMVEVLPVDIDI